MPPVDDRRVLVVGTTPDYIEWIRRACPGRSVFITEEKLRRAASEPVPGPEEEIRCDLTDLDRLRQALAGHMRRWHLTINGVACFDCESLAPAAHLARELGLAFPAPAAIANCRDKLLSKILWRKTGLSAPRVAPVSRVEEVLSFFQNSAGGCVLKPVSGSGSELVFCCRTEAECRRSFALLREGLQQRTENRLYQDKAVASGPMIVEEYIDATEFSCDFLLENGRAAVIRLAGKIRAPKAMAFGTTMGYVLLAELPGIDLSTLAQTLAKAAMALGLVRAVCMADFMIRQGEIVFLEITPRPGGDCLPALIRQALGLDTILLTLDLAQGRSWSLESLPPPRPMVGLRLHARQEGRLKKINWAAVEKDPRVKEICRLRRPGETIRLPPADYTSFLLGNIIFTPDRPETVMDECLQMIDRLTVEMDA